MFWWFDKVDCYYEKVINMCKEIGDIEYLGICLSNVY